MRWLHYCKVTLKHWSVISMSCTASATLLSSPLQMKWLFQGKHLEMASAQTSQLHCTFTGWIRLAEVLACQSRIWPWTDLLVRKKMCQRTLWKAHYYSSQLALPLTGISSSSLTATKTHHSDDAASNWLNSFFRIFPHQHQPQTCRSSCMSKSGEYLRAWMRIIM